MVNGVQISPNERLRLAEAELEMARHELRLARDRRTTARAKVAMRLAAYNRATPTITPEQNIRRHIESENAERARRAGQPYQSPYKGGPSVVDRMAHALSGGNFRAGGGTAYRRGGVSFAQAAALNAQRIRQERASATANAEYSPAKAHGAVIAKAAEDRKRDL